MKLLAERKAGEKLRELEKSKRGDRRSTSYRVELDPRYRETLESNQISDNQAARWQQVAGE